MFEETVNVPGEITMTRNVRYALQPQRSILCLTVSPPYTHEVGKPTKMCVVCVGLADALHTYFGLCGLSLMQEPGLRTIHAALNITQRAADHLHKLHDKMNR